MHRCRRGSWIACVGVVYHGYWDTSKFKSAHLSCCWDLTRCHHCLTYFIMSTLHSLSILCAFVGLRIPDSRSYYLRKSLALLGPIHRTILKRRSTSLFWSTLKLSVLNNYALVMKECSMDTQRVVLAMEILLQRTIDAKKVEPDDASMFQRNLESLQRHRFQCTITVASAAWKF